MWNTTGTVIDQDRLPGERVEFGTTVSVTEARSCGWLAGGASLLLGLAGLLWRKPPKSATTHKDPVRDEGQNILVVDVSANPVLCENFAYAAAR